MDEDATLALSSRLDIAAAITSPEDDGPGARVMSPAFDLSVTTLDRILVTFVVVPRAGKSSSYEAATSPIVELVDINACASRRNVDTSSKDSLRHASDPSPGASSASRMASSCETSMELNDATITFEALPRGLFIPSLRTVGYDSLPTLCCYECSVECERKPRVSSSSLSLSLSRVGNIRSTSVATANEIELSLQTTPSRLDNILRYLCHGLPLRRILARLASRTPYRFRLRLPSLRRRFTYRRRQKPLSFCGSSPSALSPQRDHRPKQAPRPSLAHHFQLRHVVLVLVKKIITIMIRGVHVCTQRVGLGINEIMCVLSNRAAGVVLSN